MLAEKENQALYKHVMYKLKAGLSLGNFILFLGSAIREIEEKEESNPDVDLESLKPLKEELEEKGKFLDSLIVRNHTSNTSSPVTATPHQIKEQEADLTHLAVTTLGSFI